jgi:hypothetical protein
VDLTGKILEQARLKMTQTSDNGARMLQRRFPSELPKSAARKQPDRPRGVRSDAVNESAADLGM